MNLQGRRLRGLFLALIALLFAAGAVAWIGKRQQVSLPPRSASERPELLLLTALPLIFPEEFSLDGGGSKALDTLEQRYRVSPIAVADAESLAGKRLLLMAHPQAQPAEALVELDAWVRRGGRVMILADPRLEWPSERPLGDKLRPPLAFADTGLLRHWGLRLDAPDQRGPKIRRLGGGEILASSPGQLFGRCSISRDGFVARCRLGRGSAVIVADADFLNIDQLDGPTDHNLSALIVELAQLER
jgi:hypothetical protein